VTAARALATTWVRVSVLARADSCAGRAGVRIVGMPRVLSPMAARQGGRRLAWYHPARSHHDPRSLSEPKVLKINVSGQLVPQVRRCDLRPWPGRPGPQQDGGVGAAKACIRHGGLRDLVGESCTSSRCSSSWRSA
jgi:hypothetical protein